MAVIRCCIALFLTAVSCSALSSFQGQDLVFKHVSSDSPNSDNPRALLTDSNGSAVRNVGGKQISICLYAFLENPKSDHVTIFNYSSHHTAPSIDQASLSIYSNEGLTILNINNDVAAFKVTPPLRQWALLCVTWNSNTGFADLYIDGELEGHDEDIMKDSTIGSGGYFILGANPSSYDSDFQPEDGVEGRLTDFNLWNYALREDEVQLVQQCQLEGNDVSWRNSNWTLYGNVNLQPTDAPCGSASEELTLETLMNLYLNERSQSARQQQELQEKVNILENNMRVGAEEITSLQSRLDAGSNALTALQQGAVSEFNSIKNRMDEAEKFLKSFTQGAEKEINALKQTAGNEISSLAKRLETAEKEFTEFRKVGIEEINSLKKSAGDEISSLKNRLDAAERELNTFKMVAQEELQALKAETVKEISAIQDKVSQCCDS